MNAISIGEYHGLRVGSALLSIVAGCIIIGVSKDCDADAVGGIFLGAGGLDLMLWIMVSLWRRRGFEGLLISVYPFIRAWFNFHHILPNIGNFRVHPLAAPEQPPDTLKREGTQGQLTVERSKSRMGTFVETAAATAEGSQEDGPSSDVPDILGRRKPKPSEQDLP